MKKETFVIIRFKNHTKSKCAWMSPFTFYLDVDSSTGPLIPRGQDWEMVAPVKSGDVLEFSTTKFAGEFDFKHLRGKRLLNALNGPKKRRKR